MNIISDAKLSDYSTMAVGGTAQAFVTITTIDELVEAISYAKTNAMKFAVIGEGSNTLFSDQGFDGLVIKNEISGLTFTSDGKTTLLSVGAGENWDQVVSQAVDRGLSGIEALSYIPGSAGAAPVQNIGAYGQELKDSLESVEILDTDTLELKKLQNSECEFSYRDSRFKMHRNEIVLSFVLRLRPGEIEGDLYESLAQYLSDHQITGRSPATIRAALEVIRWSKLPKPAELPNCGSYFHNVIVDVDTLEQLKAEFHNLKFFPFKDKFKIPSGWMLEELGLKGFCHSHGFCTYDKQALVITNPSRKTYADLLQFENMIRKMVRDHFGLELVREPILVD